VLQCVTVEQGNNYTYASCGAECVFQCVAACCSVLQRVAVYCGVLQCIAVVRGIAYTYTNIYGKRPIHRHVSFQMYRSLFRCIGLFSDV